MSDLVRAQLASILETARGIAATADALLAAVDSRAASSSDARPALDPGPPSPCSHPEASRLPSTRMGYPHAWICAACGYNGDDGPVKEG